MGWNITNQKKKVIETEQKIEKEVVDKPQKETNADHQATNSVLIKPNVKNDNTDSKEVIKKYKTTTPSIICPRTVRLP